MKQEKFLSDLLDELSTQIIKGHPQTDDTEPQDDLAARLKAVKENCVVVLPAGGYGSRLESVTQGSNSHKTSYRLPDGGTMIERVIAMYREAGITEFVALIYHHGEDIVDLLGDGSHMGVHIQYSEDPGKPVGRGGAIYHALTQGILPEGKYLIVHNPDDQIVIDENRFVDDILAAHLTSEGDNALATVVVANGSPYPFTGMTIDNGTVASIEMYPFIPVPLHIGVTVFSPAITAYFLKLFTIQEKVDFESVLFPVLVEESKLAAKVIEHERHIAVNDPKSFKKFLNAITLTEA